MTNPKLKQAIESGDVDSARIEIRAIADADIGRDTPIAVLCADQAHSEFMAQGKSLYEEDDGRFSMPPQGEWSKALLYKIKGGLDWNFSRERLVHLQNLTSWLHERESSFSELSNNASPRRTSSAPSGSPESGKWIKYAAIGAAALALGVVAFRILARNN